MELDIRSHLTRVANAISALGGEVSRFSMQAPASTDEVAAIELAIGRRLPEGLRSFFVDHTKGIDFLWSLDAEPLPSDEVFSAGLSGGTDLELAAIPIDILNWSGWRECFEDPATYNWPPNLNLEAYDVLFPLVAVLNGDQLVVAVESGEPSSVLYLDHEGGDFDRAVLAPTLEDFLRTWLTLGCPGPESWELEKFYDYESQCLSLTAGAAPEWLRLLGLGNGA